MKSKKVNPKGRPLLEVGVVDQQGALLCVVHRRDAKGTVRQRIQVRRDGSRVRVETATPDTLSMMKAKLRPVSTKAGESFEAYVGYRKAGPRPQGARGRVHISGERIPFARLPDGSERHVRIAERK